MIPPQFRHETEEPDLKTADTGTFRVTENPTSSLPLPTIPVGGGFPLGNSWHNWCGGITVLITDRGTRVRAPRRNEYLFVIVTSPLDGEDER